MTIVVLLPDMDGSGSLFDDFIAALGTRTITLAYPPDRPLISSRAADARVITISGPHALLQCRPSQSATALKVFAADFGITL
jgi:hypothetical protein